MYFAALLARTEDGWEASDTELDDVETLSDLTDLAREASVDEDTVLVYIEQEDAWFGVVRVDGEEDPRIYISDASAAARSSYGEILLTDELLGREPGAEDDDRRTRGARRPRRYGGRRAGRPPGRRRRRRQCRSPNPTWIRRTPTPYRRVRSAISEILADLGLSEKDLLTLRTDALAEIADALGASDVLEAVR